MFNICMCSERRRGSRIAAEAYGQQTGKGQESRIREEDWDASKKTGKGETPSAAHEVIAWIRTDANVKVFHEFPIRQAAIHKKYVITEYSF